MQRSKKQSVSSPLPYLIPNFQSKAIFRTILYNMQLQSIFKILCITHSVLNLFFVCKEAMNFSDFFVGSVCTFYQLLAFQSVCLITSSLQTPLDLFSSENLVKFEDYHRWRSERVERILNKMKDQCLCFIFVFYSLPPPFWQPLRKKV